jgi:uncharacterized hydrophobic protein (TIGR00271 family)
MEITNTAEERELRRAAVRRSVAEASTFDLAYVLMNTLATVVACYGLLANSPAVVIGAMIIAMLLGPISGVGLSLVDGDDLLLRRAMVALLGGLLVVLGTAFCIGLVHSDIPVTDEMISRTAPDLLALMVALAGGAAGAFAVASPRLSVAFVGVAIATALVPPLSTCGLLIARGAWVLAGGAFLLAFTNIVAIQFASSLVFLLNGYRRVSAAGSFRSRPIVRNSFSVIAMVVLGGLLAGNLKADISKTRYDAAVRKSLKAELDMIPGDYLGDIQINEGSKTAIIRALVRGPVPFNAGQVSRMQQRLPRSPKGLPAELRIRFVHTDVMSATGPMFDKEEEAATKELPADK